MAATAGIGSENLDTSELYARGLRRRKAMFGDADVEQRMAAAGEFGAPLQNIINAYVYGDVWERSGLSNAVRSLVMLGVTELDWPVFEVSLAPGVRVRLGSVPPPVVPVHGVPAVASLHQEKATEPAGLPPVAVPVKVAESLHELPTAALVPPV